MSTNSGWLDDEQQRVWRSYRRMAALLAARVNRDMARDSGLSEPDYDVLSHLSESPEHKARLSELAGRMLWSNSRLSHHLTRMQQRGLVRRCECPDDGRGANIVLTDEGLRAIEAAAPAHVASVRAHFVNLLDEDQLRVLGDIADTVLNHLTRD
ncbi:MarR family winged helix-turn-helix transcriptional regulator [Labedaea rhizosphaerae]|uniref:MarR family transcriptional regulator n=1 Tax=Labedaea rhizosphaerae TaxID=598644 RepID=A0A4R6RYC3_LABRH|nr:MarR family winged helix-turn-helix transcriptional regulator [Labedaea rhizosphaerae]TDP92110.1 MarR family transcriptional regulator [Labedaea rhizosphaerae]